jgi:hypothetical protein
MRALECKQITHLRHGDFCNLGVTHPNLMSMRKLSLLAVFAIAACAAKSNPAPESVMSGSAALSTFPAAPTSVRLVDETGRASTAPIASDGSFSMTLPRGHTYKVSFVAANDVPIVFPRQTGALDTTFSIKSNGARIALGAVRYLAAAPATGFTVSAGASHGDDEVEDDDKATCDDGSESSGAKTTEADTPDNRADGSKPMAVAEHDAPNEVDGCDKGDDGENEKESEGSSKD